MNVLPIVNNDWLFATVDGLRELEMIIDNREQNLFRNRKVPRDSLEFDSILKPAIQRREKKIDRFEEDIIRTILEKEDIEDKPLELFTPSLKGYIKDLHNL